MAKAYLSPSREQPRPATSGPTTDDQPLALWGNAAAQEQLLAPLTTTASGSTGSQALPDLGTLLDDLGKVSGTLRSAVDAARSAGWDFAYGTPGQGTCTKRDTKPPRVEIDPNDAKAPSGLASTLAHELGHVLDSPPAYQFDPSWDRTKYITENTMLDLAGEAEATIMELEVRDDFLAAGENDPGITGGTAAQKIALWEDFKKGSIGRDQLVHELSLLFARHEKPSTDASATTYWDFYARNHADAWDKNNPPAKPLPPPP